MIDNFRGEYAFLSNFYPCIIEKDEILYPSVEHYFQAAKTLNKEEKLVIAQTASPSMAKRKGRHVNLRSDWEIVKVAIMEEGLRLKFKDPTLKHKLLDTKEELLVEGNTWNDRFWGMCNGVGKNMLGKLLMTIRKEYQKEGNL